MSYHANHEEEYCAFGGDGVLLQYCGRQFPANFSHTQIRSGLRAGIPYDDSSDKIHYACASFGIPKAESEQFSAELGGRLTIIFKHHYRPAGALE